MILLFCIDKSYTSVFQHCIRTIEKNGGADLYEIYVLHSDLNDADKEEIQSTASWKIKIHYQYVDPDIFLGFPITERYPVQVYYRIIAPLLLPKHIDRILYLDADTVVINSLKELYEMDFEGAGYIGCTHVKSMLKWMNLIRLGVKKDVPYINSGVLLMNLELLREVVNIGEVKEYARRKGYGLFYPDQDIISAIYGDRIKLADSMVYNLWDGGLFFYNLDLRNLKKDVTWVKKNSVIIHYCGRIKPWNKGYVGRLKEFYDYNVYDKQEGNDCYENE